MQHDTCKKSRLASGAALSPESDDGGASGPAGRYEASSLYSAQLDEASGPAQRDGSAAGPAQPEASRSVPPDACYCPISLNIMKDPVIASDGFTYDRESIELWLRDHETSPTTNDVLSTKTLFPNRTLKSLIQEWL